MKITPAHRPQFARFGITALALATYFAIMAGTADGQVPPVAATPPNTTVTVPVYHNAWGIYPTYQADNDTGFVPIFNGKTLEGWEGDTTFWRAEKGEIIGESTPQKVVKLNNFLIWRGGTVRDFELKADFKLGGTNSGIQYRSAEAPEIGRWVMKGYQADMDFANDYSGNVHEERGRGTGAGHVVLAPRGFLTRITDGPHYQVLGQLGDPILLRGVMNVGGWNTYHIIARGPVMIQIINGQVMAITIDEDPKHFVPEGLLGLQMHSGPSFKVEFRNIRYRKL